MVRSLNRHCLSVEESRDVFGLQCGVLTWSMDLLINGYTVNMKQ